MLSLPHLAVLFIVALVIFGPQKLPELARMLGKATAEFRKMTGDFRYALEQEVSEMERQTRIKEAETAAAAAKAQSPAEPPVGTTPRDAPVLGVPEPGIAEPGVPESGAWETTVPSTSEAIAATDPWGVPETSTVAANAPPATETVPDLPPHVGSPADATSTATKSPEKLEKLTDDNAAA